MKFTPKQRSAIFQRLEASSEVAADLGLDPNETRWDCDVLIMMVAGSRGLVLSALSEEQRFILLDAIERVGKEKGRHTQEG